MSSRKPRRPVAVLLVAVASVALTTTSFASASLTVVAVSPDSTVAPSSGDDRTPRPDREWIWD